MILHNIIGQIEKLFEKNGLLVLWLFTTFSLSAQTSIDSLFEAGNNAYNEGDYQEAILKYDQIIDQGKHSASLYFNMANSYYRLNMIAESNYYYEKAKLLDPSNADIQINSEFAQNMTLDTIIPLGSSPLQQAISFYFKFFSVEQWAIVTIILLWLFVIAVAWFVFSRRTYFKRLFFVLFIVLFILWGLSFGTTYHLNSENKNKIFAIIFSEQLKIYSEPNQRSEVQFYLHEGTKVELLDELQDWQNIRIANGAEGWINQADIRIID